MGIFVWLVAQHPMREELKCAKMMCGVQSVMMDGAAMMPEWSADNWDLKHKVCEAPHFLADLRASGVLGEEV